MITNRTRALDHPSPPWWRIALAFLLTPLLVSFGVSCFQPGFEGISSMPVRIAQTTELYALIGGYPATILLGMPAFFVLRLWLRPSLVNCVVVGGVVASLPWLVLLALPPSPRSSESVDGVDLVIDGVRTGAGWLGIFQAVGEIAGLGALAGIIFWMIAVAGAKSAAGKA